MRETVATRSVVAGLVQGCDRFGDRCWSKAICLNSNALRRCKVNLYDDDMECYTVNGTGLDGLCPGERPGPDEPGHGQVRIDVRAVSLNYRDLMVADGRYGGEQDPPIIACSDMAGEVVQVGEGVTSLRPGDRVLNAPFRHWPAGVMRPDWVRTFVGGNGVDGVLAQELVYPADGLVAVPDHLDFVQGSTLTIAGLTAWAAVVTHGKAKPGDWVLVHGTGGVSIFATQIAKALGARVIMSTSSKDKAELVKQKLGVDATFDYHDADWPRLVRGITAGGVDIVVEVAGGASLGRSVRCCGYGGRVAVIGVLDGLDSQINIRDLLSHQVTIRGIFMESTQELRALAAAVGANKIKPWVDKVFPFSRARDAYEHLQSQRHIGKVVIQLAGGGYEPG